MYTPKYFFIERTIQDAETAQNNIWNIKNPPKGLPLKFGSKIITAKEMQILDVQEKPLALMEK